MDSESRRWRAKVAAWVHDPAEKAFVLLRDPAGHEAGTCRLLREQLFPGGLGQDLKDLVKEADHWAAAADRPQFPRAQGEGPYAPWAQVDFASTPQLIHPLSGERTTPSDFNDVEVEPVKAISLDHLARQICRQDEAVDFRRTFLSLWRFGPESPAAGLGALWPLLPADTRVPDHAIWEHLRLCSAYAGAAAAGSPSLLLMSLGPIQGFIAQARSTSDLWSGSHLLSTLIWEGMRVVAERYGPDAILFPDLHGVPIVDLWLANEGVDFSWMEEKQRPSWMRLASDANPLFSAALPNRFLALVPEDEAEEVARAVRDTVRAFAAGCASAAWQAVLEEAGMKDGDGLSQIGSQLRDFPEVAWSVVPASLGKDPGKLEAALQRHYPADESPPGFLGSPVYRTLAGDVQVDGARFYRPGPGTLYPALYDLAERSHAAAKSTRPFDQLEQRGFRCSLCGEREWLTTDRGLLDYHTRRDQPDSPWTKVGQTHPAWAKPGERLCAHCCTKRLWPKLFTKRLEADFEPVRELLPRQLSGTIQRYVVSTHTMALAPTFQWMVEHQNELDTEKLQALCDELGDAAHTALPRRLLENWEGLEDVLRKLPAALDDARESTDGGKRYERIRSKFKAVTNVKPETYYGLILLDGDRMGQWLAGDAEGLPTYEQIFHARIATQVRERVGRSDGLEAYLGARRAPTPAFHGAISRALNGFSLHVARAIVEDAFLGKVIYAGGDDLLAMVAVRDLVPALVALRCAYAGQPSFGPEKEKLEARGGYVLLKTRKQRRLLRMMGTKATLSGGAVVAHHMTPLGAVLRYAREAEHAAKATGGRDAFCVSLVKRSGGVTRFVSKWDLANRRGPADSVDKSPAGVLLRTRDALAAQLSRRAAYHIIDWLNGMPTEPDMPSYEKMLEVSVLKVFRRQQDPKHRDNADTARQLAALAADLASLAVRHGELRKEQDERGAPGFLQDLITAAEFLAREQRGAAPKGGKGR